MCSNPEKAQYLKILIEEIRAAVAQRRARKRDVATPPFKTWPGRPKQAALIRSRRPA